VIPSFSLTEEVLGQLEFATKAMAKELNVRGLMNVQFAVKDGKVYVLEVNPRASRTVPFVSKAIGVPLAKLAAKVMAGHKLSELNVPDGFRPKHYAVKEAVFPFIKFPGTDITLGPEMRSTGEVMGIDPDLGIAYAKAQMSAQPALPKSGGVFISVKDTDKEQVVPIAREFAEAGFVIHATPGTLTVLREAGVAAQHIYKLNEGRPNLLDLIKNGEIQCIVNTPHGKVPRQDEVAIRSAAVAHRVPIMTTLRGARMSIKAIRSLQAEEYQVRCLQEYQGA
jgi:carbamoyl-phosphate synthase large subunit